MLTKIANPQGVVIGRIPFPPDRPISFMAFHPADAEHILRVCDLRNDIPARDARWTALTLRPQRWASPAGHTEHRFEFSGKEDALLLGVEEFDSRFKHPFRLTMEGRQITVTPTKSNTLTVVTDGWRKEEFSGGSIFDAWCDVCGYLMEWAKEVRELDRRVRAVRVGSPV